MKQVAFGLVAAMTFFSGCAAMIKQACSEEGAYSAGMNDGRGGERMNSGYNALCEEPDKARAASAYRTGYADGLKSMKEAQPQVVINVNQQSARKKWVCQISAWGQTFTASADRRDDAVKDVKGSCRQTSNSLVCDQEPTCRSNF